MQDATADGFASVYVSRYSESLDSSRDHLIEAEKRR